MEQSRIDGSRLILLLIGVGLGMTLVATIALWSEWSPLMRGLVLVADIFWVVGVSRLISAPMTRSQDEMRTDQGETGLSG